VTENKLTFPFDPLKRCREVEFVVGSSKVALVKARRTTVKSETGMRLFRPDIIRCSYTKYEEEKSLLDSRIRLSDILLECDSLINVPILTGITFFGAGISFALKNHFGTFDRPRDFHGEKFVAGVTELNNLPDIKDRTRLIVGDILTSKSYRSSHERYVIAGNKILTSFDPVALDSVGAQIAEAAYAAEGKEDAVVIKQAMPWLRRASEMGLGTAASENIDLVEIDL
jgi:hypothetical protein